ncbi:transposase [Streptomyces sp. NPDC007025]|uniref:transposase n=1 Tax=Streptomyces sp. NPDC007025 TaxID=3364771 RepID=UPI0036C437AF
MSIMESMRKKPRRARRSFTPEFKAEIGALCRRRDRSVGQVAKDFGLAETRVRDWVRQAEIDEGDRAGLTDQQRACGTDRAATGEPTAAGGRGGSQASHGFLREGDPVNVHRFIEAEKRAGHSIKRTCELLKVRAAYYARRTASPGPPCGARR